MLRLLIIILCSAAPKIYGASIHSTEIQHSPIDDAMTIHILEVQPLIRADKHTEHVTADSHTVHEVVHLVPVEVNKNTIIDEQEHKVITVIPLTHTEDTKQIPKVHQVVNLIPDDDKNKIIEPKKITLTLTAHDEDKKTPNIEVTKSREKKAFPIIQHVLIPTNIHTYYPVQQDLRVIPLSRESFQTQVQRYNEYEPSIYQTYYGGFGNGLNFGGHGAGHGFYAYG